MTRKVNYARGERHPNVKHSDEIVREAIRLRDQGHSYGRIGEALGVKKHTVYQWVTGMTRAEA